MDTSPVDEDALRRFEAAWRSGQAGVLKQFLPPANRPTYLGTLAALVDLEMRLAWAGWKPPADGSTAVDRPRLLETYLQRFPPLRQPPLMLRLIQREYLVRHGNGDRPSPGEYCQRFPAVVRGEQDVLAFADTESQESVSFLPAPRFAAAEIPGTLGGYRILAKLGAGSFGVVYKGHDDQLGRDVAIKVPHRHLLSRPEHVARYLAEARVLASLEHPAIVPIYAVGDTDGRCFLVSKFVGGGDLAGRLAQGRLPPAESVELVATVAEALHYTHLQRLVHRDVKPANILLDTAGRPYLTDFGLALRDEDFGRGAGLVGTPVYMSPEQARGEGHRVDGRSDIFSLGVVFYELLTGRQPFGGRTRDELLEQITGVEARPPRQLDASIPREPERICLKALAKRASERYTTARDMAEDLRFYLTTTGGVPAPCGPAGTERRPGPVPDTGGATLPIHSPAAVPQGVSSGNLPLARIVPKGLRSFDAQDADFFLDLLPGPRDREGLPEGLRFWKRRVEQTDADQTFSVGLLYGPSGCGKSSLVKAGLLPRLARHVRAVYVEATADETEARLLKALRRRCPDLPGDLGLTETIAALRRARGPAAGEKVLLVLDQFEQFLHARHGEENSVLAQALRQCDGGRVQALLMVRDDFWMAMVRFMEELEVRILQGDNSAATDLFDLRHTRNVLTAFGRAFGALPEAPTALSREQKAFLDQAVAGLAQEGRVICVWLALFAEMVKGRPWTPAALKEVGGTAGVGVAFLEEAFGSAAAPPTHRLHQGAARAVLQALLPEQGTDIKGHMRSREELLAASGYAPRPRDFEELLRILDGEARLITPTESGGEDSRDEGRPAAPGGKYYQLTHDYLVPALREWLTRKRKETRRGRAELRLVDRAAAWSARPEGRHLPAWWEWVNIRLLTHKKDWTPAESRMMRQAGRCVAVRGAVLLLVVLLAWGGYTWVKAQLLVDWIVHAYSPDEVPPLIRQLSGCRFWADYRLRQLQPFRADAQDHLYASLALLPVDESQVEYLYGRLLKAAPRELPVIRDALRPKQGELKDRLWEVLDNTLGDPGQRLRAACALADYDGLGGGQGRHWQNLSQPLANWLLDAIEGNPGDYGVLKDSLQPVRDLLREPLTHVHRDENRPQSERLFATSLLADYYRDRTDVLVDLALDADQDQFALLFQILKRADHRDRAIALCEERVTTPLDPDKPEEEKENLARRQAIAGVILLRFGDFEQVWPLLKHRPDPRARSYLIHRFGLLRADPKPLSQQLLMQKDVSIRRALLLSLGSFHLNQLPADDREQCLLEVQRLHRDDDAGLHAAAEWLLRQWDQQKKVREAQQAWAADSRGRRERLERIGRALAKEKADALPQWYVNGQGQTMVVVPGPVTFRMGSPVTESGREHGPRGREETLHWKRIGRSYAIAAKEVTVEEFRRCPYERYGEGKDGEKEHYYTEQVSPTPDCPMHVVTWYEAAAYCNWLSEKEGIEPDQWCYLPNDKGKFAEGMKVKDNFLHLEGYRLPTEAEWECACRAGAWTSRFYGERDDLLDQYAWYGKNTQGRQMQPVGGLKPNDLGLFDMLGNALEWCQDRFVAPYVRGEGENPSEDVEGDDLDITNDRDRVMRGSAYTHWGYSVRSADRYRYPPSMKGLLYGFRPARTFPYPSG
jgi:serine/threonine protein kinase/formylglycine-generating enzyme required for sulfatase activity